MAKPAVQQQQGLVPIPDPSILTTEALAREILHLRELMERRFDAMDKALYLAPAAVDEKIDALRNVSDERFRAANDVAMEKFSSIEKQFKERDVRTEQSSKDSKVAVDAALQAAKEAVGKQNESSSLAIAKSETATTKQIDQIMLQIAAAGKASDDKITDVKDRLTRIEGRGEGSARATTDRRDAGQYVVALIGLVMGTLIGAAGLVLSYLARR